jgi:hypothetical protein
MMKAEAATQSNGFEWRILLGPTHNWQVPSTELSTTQQSSIERSELCGEPIGDGRPFTTNSAGQYPVHVACSGSDEPLVNRHRPAQITWLRFLRSCVSG